MANTQAVAERIESYVRERFLVRDGDDQFSHTIDLWENGYVDSLGTIELISFMEGTFSVAIPAGALSPDERKCIAGLAALVVELSPT